MYRIFEIDVTESYTGIYIYNIMYHGIAHAMVHI